MSELLEFRTEDHIAILTLNRPEARNAMNPELAAAIEDAIDRLENDDDLWVGILAATGSSFCAGADLKVVAGGEARNIETKRGGFGGLVRRERDKPLIAAVEGPAVAGGSELVLACDLVVASTNASFGLPEVKRSLVAAAGGLARLPRALPPAIAMELILTGDPITATRAHHFGLVNELTEPGHAVGAALALAGRIAANAPLAVRASRRAALASRLVPDAEAMKIAGREMRDLAATDDFREGPLAFIEKRPAEWKGR